MVERLAGKSVQQHLVGIHLAAQSALEDLGPTEQLHDFSKVTRLIVYRCYHYHLRYTSYVAFKDDMWRVLIQAGWTGGRFGIHVKSGHKPKPC